MLPLDRPKTGHLAGDHGYLFGDWRKPRQRQRLETVLHWLSGSTFGSLDLGDFRSKMPNGEPDSIYPLRRFLLDCSPPFSRLPALSGTFFR
jgi:hypothetical protein